MAQMTSASEGRGGREMPGSGDPSGKRSISDRFTEWSLNWIPDSMVFVVVFCLSVVALGVATIADNRRYTKHMHERAEEAARWKKYGNNLQRPPQK